MALHGLTPCTGYRPFVYALQCLTGEVDNDNNVNYTLISSYKYVKL